MLPPGCRPPGPGRGRAPVLGALRPRAGDGLCVCRNEGLLCQSQGHARDTRSPPATAPPGPSGLQEPSGPPALGPLPLFGTLA